MYFAQLPHGEQEMQDASVRAGCVACGPSGRRGAQSKIAGSAWRVEPMPKAKFIAPPGTIHIIRQDACQPVFQVVDGAARESIHTERRHLHALVRNGACSFCTPPLVPCGAMDSLFSGNGQPKKEHIVDGKVPCDCGCVPPVLSLFEQAKERSRRRAAKLAASEKPTVAQLLAQMQRSQQPAVAGGSSTDMAMSCEEDEKPELARLGIAADAALRSAAAAAEESSRRRDSDTNY